MNPFYILSAAPTHTTSFPDFFGTSGAFEVLQDPGELRYAGWSLRTLDVPRLVRGEYLEVRNGERKQIQLFSDGTLIAKLAADDSFLAWAATKEGQAFAEHPRLNPLALVEVTHHFVLLYAKLLSLLQPQPKELVFRAQFERAIFGTENSKLYLPPYGIDTWAWMMDDEVNAAPDASMFREIRIDVATVERNPGRVTYLLLEQVYAWFGMANNKIPYTAGDGGDRIIDPTTFVKKG